MDNIMPWGDFFDEVKKITYKEYRDNIIDMTAWTKNKFKWEFHEYFTIHNWEVGINDCVRGHFLYTRFTIVQKPNKHFCINISHQKDGDTTEEYWYCEDYDNAIKLIHDRIKES